MDVLRYRHPLAVSGMTGGSISGRLYRQLRLLILAREPLCRMCKSKGRATAAEEVDHIVPRARGGSVMDPDNLQPLCRSCHDAKTRAEAGHRRKNRLCEKHGWPAASCPECPPAAQPASRVEDPEMLGAEL